MYISRQIFWMNEPFQTKAFNTVENMSTNLALFIYVLTHYVETVK